MKRLALLLTLLIPALLMSQPCLPEGISFTSQAQIDSFPINYPDCTEIEGHVEINGDDIYNLDGLSILNSIGGYLKIGSCDSLLNLTGLENLTSVEGNLEITDNEELMDLSGIENLASLGGNLIIGDYIRWMEYWSCRGNSSLNNISSLSKLTSISGDLYVICNTSLTDLHGLHNITSVEGDLIISSNDSLVNLLSLSHLDTIYGNLEIGVTGEGWVLWKYGNPSMTDLSGLDNLEYIGGDLNILGNDSLNSMSGLNNLNEGSIMNLSIIRNKNLSACKAQSICSYLASPNGIVEIRNNAPGCNNPGEAASECGFSMPCLPYGNYFLLSQADIDNFQNSYQDCTELEGDVIISGDDITNLNGLNGVTSLSGSLKIGNMYFGGNPSLSNLEGLEGLNSIGNDLRIYKSSLLDLTGLNNLVSIGGGLSIYDNDVLTSLLGLANIEANSIDKLSIRSNDSLSTCHVQSICDYLAGSNGSVSISNNAPGCNNVNQVSAMCGNGCLIEGITFSSQAEIDSFQINYPDCSIILGDIIIQGDDIVNLNGLKSLTSCLEGLIIQNNASLTSLFGLDSLNSIGGKLSINDNDFLTSLSGLDNVSSIEGDVNIESNDALTSLSGLDNLTSIGGYFIIYNNDALTNLTGLDNVSSIEGDVNIESNDALTSLSGLDNLTSIGGYFIIYNNDALTNLTGLDNVSSIEGDVKIEYNDALTSLSGLESLNTIGNFLFINDNNELKNISGIENINAASFKILGIFYNESLSACHVQSICNYLADPGLTFGIEYNAPGCNSPLEVLDSCDFSSINSYSSAQITLLHPNPFINSTTIEYELVKTEVVQLSIFNHLGKEVKVIEKKESQGKQQFVWNAKGQPAGVYFCVLKTETGMHSTKMIKLK